MPIMSLDLPWLQLLPVHPFVHEQVLGEAQVPPFEQPGLHTAV